MVESAIKQMETKILVWIAHQNTNKLYYRGFDGTLINIRMVGFATEKQKYFRYSNENYRPLPCSEAGIRIYTSCLLAAVGLISIRSPYQMTQPLPPSLISEFE